MRHAGDLQQVPREPEDCPSKPHFYRLVHRRSSVCRFRPCPGSPPRPWRSSPVDSHRLQPVDRRAVRTKATAKGRISTRSPRGPVADRPREPRNRSRYRLLIGRGADSRPGDCQHWSRSLTRSPRGQLPTCILVDASTRPPRPCLPRGPAADRPRAAAGDTFTTRSGCRHDSGHCRPWSSPRHVHRTAGFPSGADRGRAADRPRATSTRRVGGLTGQAFGR